MSCSTSTGLCTTTTSMTTITYFVAQYTMESGERDLIDLLQGRAGHACSMYAINQEQMLIVTSSRRYLGAASHRNTVFISGEENKEDSRSLLVRLPSTEMFLEMTILSRGEISPHMYCSK